MVKQSTYYVQYLAQLLNVSSECAEKIKDLRATNKNSQVIEDKMIKEDQQNKSVQ